MLARKKRTRAEIGAEIKRLRKECNMTQLTLGMKLHIDQAKISKLESGNDVTLDSIPSIPQRLPKAIPKC